VKKQSFQGLDLKKPGTKTRSNLNYRASLKNYRLRTAGSILEKIGGFSEKFWIKTEILLNSGGLRVYLPKTEGLLCKTPRVARNITV